MAIYSLNLKSIGRTTHAAGTAGAHLLYIARPDAQAELVSAHMPTDPNEARAWINRAEMADRKNARVVDKVRIALPRELTSEQRMQLVQDFANDLTGGRVAWFAGIHAAGKDAHNPHCHLVIRDRDVETGKRVLRLSDSPRDRTKAGLEPKAVDWVRAKWEDHANCALEQAGHEARIDRRSLEAQGIDREPTIHIGPQAAHVDQFVDRPDSKVRETGNGRTIDYPSIDEGRTRKDRHAEIVDFNLEKAARSPDLRTRELARFEKQQRSKDRGLEKQLIAEARGRTREERRMKAAVRKDMSEVVAARNDALKVLRTSFRTDWTDKRHALTERHQFERAALDQSQGRLGARLKRVFDITGRTRKGQMEERTALQDRHREERAELVATHRQQKSERLEQLTERYDIMRQDVRARHYPEISAMAAQHREAERHADQLRQQRETEREQAVQQLDRDLAKAEQLRKQMQNQRDRDRNRGPGLG